MYFELLKEESISKARKQLIEKPKQLHIHAYYMNNTRAFSMLFDGSLEAGKWKEVPGTDFGGEATMIRMRRVGGGTDIPKLTLFDRIVLDCIYTLMRNGYEHASLQTITKVVYGNIGKKVHEPQLELIRESIQRLQQVCVEIKCDNEMYARGVYEKSEEMKEAVDMNLFSALLTEEGGTYKALNGRKVTTYKLHKSFIYLYAEACEQILVVPWRLRDVCSVLDPDRTPIKRMDVDTILIRDYLLRRIEIMKHNGIFSYTNVITYSWYDKNTGEFKGMFNELGYDRTKYKKWRDKKSQLERITTELLDHFIEEEYIKRANRISESKDYKDKSTHGWEIWF